MFPPPSPALVPPGSGLGLSVTGDNLPSDSFSIPEQGDLPELSTAAARALSTISRFFNAKPGKGLRPADSLFTKMPQHFVGTPHCTYDS